LIPEEYGGSGLTMSSAIAIMEEIQAAGCNGAACHAQMYTMGTVLRHGNAEQKSRYLPKIANGELRLQAFGVTEPTSGTDTLALRTTAVRDGNDSYVINGQKIWTSRAEHSDLMLLLARTTPREQHPTSAPRRGAQRPADGRRARRMAAASLRRQRAGRRRRRAGAAHDGGTRRQRQLCHRRREDLDPARRALRPDAAARAAWCAQAAA